MAASRVAPRPRLSLRPLWFLVPVALVALALVAGNRGLPDAPPPRPAPARDGSPRTHGRLVVLLVDSLARANVEDAALMPNLHALSRAQGTAYLDVRTCASNFSLPCIQTIFAGRESPMSAGLEQFSSYGASSRNFVESAAAAGLNVAIVGNDMLSTLYGRHARFRYSIVPLHLDALPSDLAAIAQGERYLDDPSVDVLLLHTNGTDHVTHWQLPGTDGYVRHFRRVDARLAQLIARLDFSTDSLVVMGDHGHDGSGHHSRESVAVLAGRRYVDLFRQIDVPRGQLVQTDLLYVLSFPQLLPMDADYEGRYFALRPGVHASADLATFLDIQRRQLEGATPDPAPSRARAVAERMQPDWRPGNEQARRSLARALPLLLCLLLWVVLTWPSSAGVRLSPWPAIACGSLALVLWLAGRWELAPPLALAAPPAAAVGWLVVARRSRVAAIALLLVAGAACSAWIEPQWRDFFHSRDEFHWGIPLFYALMLGAGLAVAAIRRGGARSWPWATQMAAFIALPVGAYYYQFDENLLRAYLIPAVIVLAGTAVVAWRRRPVAKAWPGWLTPRAPLGRAAAAAAAGALLLLPQDAGGWQWHPWLAVRLAAFPSAAGIALLAIGAAWLVSLLGSWRERVPLALLILAVVPYAIVGADLDVPRVAAAFVVVLFVGGWLALGAGAGSPADPAAPGDDEISGLMLAAAGVLIVLTTCDGFVIENVDVTFALQYTRSLRGDTLIALTAALPVALKYAAPLLVLLAFHRLLLGPQASERATGCALLFLVFKMLGLLVQALVGALNTGEKFFELAQIHFLFVSCLAVVVGIWTVVLWSADRLVDAYRRRWWALVPADEVIDGGSARQQVPRNGS